MVLVPLRQAKEAPEEGPAWFPYEQAAHPENFRGRVVSAYRRARSYYVTAKVALTYISRALRYRFVRPRVSLPGQLRSIVIGTTGLCNASCLSCPTGKPETAHVPRVPMPMPLFEKIVKSLVDDNLVVKGRIAFGLFGDALADPYVVERAKMVRRLIPDCYLVVNTNGAAYNPKKHRELLRYVSYLVVHLESLDPKTYEYLMAPLRADRVFPKLRQIFQDFPGRVWGSVPLSQVNLKEARRLRSALMKLGANKVVFDPVSNRCSPNPEPFRSLALNPGPIRCPSEVLDDLIVDCDGQVLVCCQDFQRLEPIADLNTETLPEALTNVRRYAMRKRFDEGRHTEMKTCSNCYADIRGKLVLPEA